MKKIVTLLLVMVMIFSLATTAFAATNDSITITDTNVGETYKIYKMFDLVVDNDENPTKFSYTINKDWTAFFTGEGAGAQYITVENGYVKEVKNSAALAKAAAEWEGKPAELQTIVADSETVVFDNLENGYWLVTSTLGTIAMAETTPDNENVTIKEKNPENTIDKTVKEDSTNIFGKENDAQVGDTVYFQSAVKLVKGTRNVVIHDAMDDGLTLNTDSIAIEGLTKETEYTVAFNTDDGCDFEITFTETYLNSLIGETDLTLTYNAVLNENAIVTGENGTAIVDQYNKTTIKYGDATSVKSETKTTTHKVTVNKYADGAENLAGAVFSLKKNGVVIPLVKIDDMNYRVAKAGETGAVDTFTTVATGDIVIWGLDTDTDYTLEEITAPAGYNKLPAEVDVTVNADNSTQVDVENKAGTELPSTGGVGTTMFYVIGGLMMLMAVVLLVTKKRMAAAE